MAAQKGRIRYVATAATPARSPYHAAAFYLLPTPWLSTIPVGSTVDLYLDWAYDKNEPHYAGGDRSLATSSSGVTEVRHFLAGENYKLSLSEITEEYAVEYTQNGTFDADLLWTKAGPEWTISGGVAICDGTQAGTSNLTNAGVVVPGTVEAKIIISGVTAGTITPIIGGVAGTARSADGTYAEEIAATGTSIVLQADASFVGNVSVVSVKSTGIVSDFAVMNALNLEIDKGTVLTWWPDYDARPSDYYSVTGNKRIEPKRLRKQYKWAFDLDLKILPTVQFPSTVPPFVAI